MDQWNDLKSAIDEWKKQQVGKPGWLGGVDVKSFLFEYLACVLIIALGALLVIGIWG